MRPRELGFTGWALAIFGAIGVLLIGLILYLNARVGEQEARFAQAKVNYNKLIKLRLRYRDQEALIAKGGPKTNQDRTISHQSFLEQKAREAGLPTLNIREDAGRAELKERAFTVTVNAAANNPVPRRNFIRFLDLVETARPSFKSKNISFKFQTASPDELQTASATFSDYERQ